MTHDKAAIVERFFARTGPSYDAVVRYFTLGIDWRWKRRILAALPPTPRRVLDLACGTGILTFAIARAYPDCRVVGVDISRGYLDVAEAKAARSDRVTFVHQLAETFVSDQPFDAVTASYLPKYADLDRLIPQIAAMLVPGGVVILHDFTYPTHSLLQQIFRLYFRWIPSIGGHFYPEWEETLRELPEVIRTTTWVAESVAAMRRSGLRDIQVTSLTLQGAALITARKERSSWESGRESVSFLSSMPRSLEHF